MSAHERLEWTAIRTKLWERQLVYERRARRCEFDGYFRQAEVWREVAQDVKAILLETKHMKGQGK